MTSLFAVIVHAPLTTIKASGTESIVHNKIVMTTSLPHKMIRQSRTHTNISHTKTRVPITHTDRSVDCFLFIWIKNCPSSLHKTWSCAGWDHACLCDCTIIYKFASSTSTTASPVRARGSLQSRARRSVCTRPRRSRLSDSSRTPATTTKTYTPHSLARACSLWKQAKHMLERRRRDASAFNKYYSIQGGWKLWGRHFVLFVVATWIRSWIRSLRTVIDLKICWRVYVNRVVYLITRMWNHLFLKLHNENQISTTLYLLEKKTCTRKSSQHSMNPTVPSCSWESGIEFTLLRHM